MDGAQHQRDFSSALGTIRLTADDRWLTGVRILVGKTVSASDSNAILLEAERQIEAYFADPASAFTLPLKPLSNDQDADLRQAMLDIPLGETRSYGDLARATGAIAKAAGQACASNPYPIIVPCHRVLPSSGVLGNYSGGEGPTTKAWLLAHEGANVPQPDLFQGEHHG